jgi:hypothetical protein
MSDLNKNNIKCVWGWYEMYDIEDTNVYVYDFETGTFNDKNTEINELVDAITNKNENEDDVKIVYMEEYYEEDSDTEDTESTRVMVDADDHFELSSI